MKTIGLIGGMSWESTQVYYRLLNETVSERLGGLSSAKIILYSVDFAEIERLQRRGEWHRAGEYLAQVAQSLQAAGADFLVIATNTMHKVAPAIESAVTIPVLHIVDATARVLSGDGVRCVGLLGTRFTMEQAFFRERLQAQGVDVIVPDEEQRETVHRVIFEELCRGVISAQSRREFLAVVAALAEQGAQAVVLGCTEIGMLIAAENTTVPLYDTTEIHTAQAVECALA